MSKPPQSKPQVIFLDAVGTLFGVRGSVGNIYSQIAQEFGVVTAPQAVNQAFYASFYGAKQPLAFPGVPLADIPELEYQWWYAIAEHTFKTVVVVPTEILEERDAELREQDVAAFLHQADGDASIQRGVFEQFEDFAAFFDYLYGYFSLPEAWEVYPDIPPTLEKWRREGVDLGIISNFDLRLHAVLEVLGLRKYFKTITLSSVNGVAKPDPKIFHEALRKHHCAPKQAWHIGDSVEHDYKGARAAGLKSFLLKRS
ncbi:MAG: HAD-IA family hydrolase [Spirulina sp. SIO3F2]|nr:HAD-IA family hydrolase [Spirulina sp. SIO3F2]